MGIVFAFGMPTLALVTVPLIAVYRHALKLLSK